MPEGAKDALRSYWEAADEHERANGRQDDTISEAEAKAARYDPSD